MRERKRLPVKKKMEFSKKILIVVSIATVLIVIASFFLRDIQHQAFTL